MTEIGDSLLYTNHHQLKKWHRQGLFIYLEKFIIIIIIIVIVIVIVIVTVVLLPVLLIIFTLLHFYHILWNSSLKF